MEENFTLKDAVDELQAGIIGDELLQRYGTWPMYSKFFDYGVRSSTTCTSTQEAAACVGRMGKPECYYYPPQLNNYPGTLPGNLFRLRP